MRQHFGWVRRLQRLLLVVTFSQYVVFVILFTVLPKNAHAQDVESDGNVFNGCSINEYFAPMASSFANESNSSSLLSPSLWTREQLELLLWTTHRRVLPYTADSNDEVDVWKALIDLDKAAETTDLNGTFVQLLYSNVSVAAFPHGTVDSWNREHVWPSSRGVGHDGPDFTDVHHLRPCDWNVNAVRSNLYFGLCNIDNDNSVGDNNNDDNDDGTCRIPANEEAASDTAKNAYIFTPHASSRGDIARALFYMDVRYSAKSAAAAAAASSNGRNERDLRLTDCPTIPGNMDPPDDEDENTDTDDDTVLIGEMAYLSILLQWHVDDPVDDAERRRNDKVCSHYQGNRNPFVDFADLATIIFGEPKDISTLSYHCNATMSSTTNTTSGLIDQSPSSAPASLSSSATNASASTVATNKTLQAGDVMIVGAQADNPDWVALVALTSIAASTALYITDNALVPSNSGDGGSSFLRNEGSLRLVVPFDMVAGTVFGYGSTSTNAHNNSTLLYGDLWTAVDKGFALSTVDGDTIIAYTAIAKTTIATATTQESDGTATDSITFLSAMSLSGPWLESSTMSASMSTATSALPATLHESSVSFNVDCAVYTGPTSGTARELHASMTQPHYWTTSNAALNGPSLLPTKFDVSSTSSTAAMSGAPTSGGGVMVLLLLTATLVVVLGRS